MKRILFNLIPALLTLILVVSGKPAHAQTPPISILSFDYLPDTVYENQTYNLSVKIKNLGNSTLNDTIVVFIQSIDTFPSVADTFIFTPNFALLPGDTAVLYTSQYQFDTLTFKTGGNTVVIWPYSKSAVTQDSTQEYMVFLNTPVGINEAPFTDQEFQISPNPAHKQFRIVSKISPEHVRIFDNKGRLMYDRAYDGKDIAIGDLKSGIYLVQCRYKNKKSLVRKLFKRD